ncbi:MAG: hypothetical protein ACE5IB_07125 [Candidatus Geothermarchaeales archaeon]
MVRVKIYHPNMEDELSTTIEGLIDSGGPISLMPIDVPEELILHEAGECNVTGVGLVPRKSPVYYPAVRLEGWDQEFPAVRFALWDGDYAILGRSLLNRFYLALSGPEARYRISLQPPPHEDP